MELPGELAVVTSAQSRDLHCLAPPQEAAGCVPDLDPTCAGWSVTVELGPPHQVAVVIRGRSRDWEARQSLEAWSWVGG